MEQAYRYDYYARLGEWQEDSLARSCAFGAGYGCLDLSEFGFVDKRDDFTSDLMRFPQIGVEWLYPARSEKPDGIDRGERGCLASRAGKRSATFRLCVVY